MSFEETIRQIFREELEKIQSDQPQQNNVPPLMSVKQTADFLGVSESKVYELTRRQDFPVTRAVGGVKITTHMLMMWLERNTNWLDENSIDVHHKII